MKFNLIFIAYYAICGIIANFTTMTYEAYEVMVYSLGLFIVLAVIYNTYKASEYIKNWLFKK
tara:strand:+ start:774 stop:959 length:186 start_codon:yes stop_codon:yes gene_type:complete